MVDSHATAMDILALVLKQLAALGIPGPHDVARLQRLAILSVRHVAESYTNTSRTSVYNSTSQRDRQIGEYSESSSVVAVFTDQIPVREGTLDPAASVFVWADTTDAGPDQAARRRHIQAAVAKLDGFFYIDINCCLHQFHLMVRDNLQIIDVFLKSLDSDDVTGGFQAYTASLAKCANFWRTHVSQFVDAWEAVHGFCTSGHQFLICRFNG